MATGSPPRTTTPSTTPSTTRWLDESEMAAWLAYVDTYQDLEAAFEADLAPTGLTFGDYQVLVYLSEAADHEMRMCDLARTLHLSPSGLTRRLDGLVDSGYVRRAPSETDRRVMLAELTDAGLRHLQRSAPVHLDSVRARMIDLLDRDELAALEAIFRKIRAALDAEASCE